MFELEDGTVEVPSELKDFTRMRTVQNRRREDRQPVGAVSFLPRRLHCFEEYQVLLQSHVQTKSRGQSCNYTKRPVLFKVSYSPKILNIQFGFPLQFK